MVSVSNWGQTIDFTLIFPQVLYDGSVISYAEFYFPNQ